MVYVTESKTKKDRAYFVKRIVDEMHFEAKKLITDNFKTHTLVKTYTLGALLEAFVLQKKQRGYGTV